MATILRQIVASPRARHPEAGLDLCYVTDNIVATSGPSSVWPKKAYRNPTDQLVAFLDRKHGEDWSIFEFRAEGTGYPDSEVYNRIHHFPWPDHHPPPFAVIPNLMAAMRNWIQRLNDTENPNTESSKNRIAVVHCKAGKGRSGTVACSYLISEEGWKREDALQRFTLRRMRTGFGQGVSIPSQLRWVRYVDRWTNSMGKKYIERPVEILEVHVWGLRDGVKVAIEGFEENGRRIRNFHTFTRDEKTVVEETNVTTKSAPISKNDFQKDDQLLTSPVEGTPQSSSVNLSRNHNGAIQTVILKPSEPVILSSSDVNIDFERRNKANYTGFTMVTAIAHVWFNAYFEGGHEGHDSGVFEIEWDAMDGIKGSARKGTRALDRLKVVWKYAKKDGKAVEQIISEPSKGEPVPEGEPANWQGDVDEEREKEAKHSDGVTSGRAGGAALTMGAMIQQGASTISKELGLRPAQPDSANISRASSVKDAEEPSSRKSAELERAELEGDDDQGVKSHVLDHEDNGGDGDGGEGEGEGESQNKINEVEGRQDTRVGHMMEAGMEKVGHVMAKVKSPDRNGDAKHSS